MLIGLTAYNPAVFALNDMLRQQLALTRAFIDSTRRHYTSVIESLEPADYKYTTLEEAKEVRIWQGMNIIYHNLFTVC